MVKERRMVFPLAHPGLRTQVPIIEPKSQRLKYAFVAPPPYNPQSFVPPESFPSDAIRSQ